MKAAGKNRIRPMIWMFTTALLFFFMLLLPPTATAVLNDHLTGSPTVQKELAGTVVNCMLQDSDGFLWFGTPIGLYKYNGYSLKPYSFTSNLADGFNLNFITSIGEDQAKNIWVGTFGGGLFKFNPQTEEYISFNDSPQSLDGLGGNAIRAICRDNGEKLWIGTQNKGLYRLDPVSGDFVRYEHRTDNSNSLSSNTVTSLCRDKTGALWIGTAGGLNKFDPQSDKFIRYKSRANTPGSAGKDYISALYIDGAGVLWVITDDGRLNGFDTASEEFMSSSFQKAEDFKVTAVCEDNSGALWIGTYGNGLRILDKERMETTAYDSDFSQDTSAGSHKVVSLYADASGNLWIGTEGNGIEKINTNLNFMSYKSNRNSGLRFSDDVILSICKDKSGIVWLGTANGGINRFDRENNRITYYRSNPQDKNSISSDAVSSIYEDRHGVLWFGTIDGTLNSFDPPAGKFVRYKINNVENPGLKDNGILRIHEDKEGILWACAANGGLVRLDKSTGLLTQFINHSQDPYSISSNHVLSITEDDAGFLWIGTGGGGLNKLDPASGKFTRYGINGPYSTTQIFNYNVTAIVNDHDLLWIATDIGLFKFDKSSGTSLFIENSQQTANIFIFGLLDDGEDNLWLSTPHGLIKYRMQSGTFKKYDFDEGLQKNQYIPGAYHKSFDNEIFFGGTNGFSCFYADKIKDNTHKPPVVISDFKIFDSSSKLPATGKISVTYKENFISFEFAALDYANPDKNQYAYKLDGFDTDWHYSGARNYAGYTNLDGGEYVFRVKAANNDGLWNEQDTQIRIAVIPPFWEKTWFFMLVFVFVSALIILLIKLRVRSIKLKNLELERQVAERTKELDQANEQLRRNDEMKSNFLSMVSHEIRTPLSAILGFTELIAAKIEKTILPNLDLKDKKTQKAAEKIGRDLNIILTEGDRLTTLVNNLLNISKIESGKMDWRKELLDLSEPIEQSLLITKPLLEKAGLAVHVDIEAGLPKVSADKDMLTQVFINLISNAVNFTKEGYIKISAQKSGDEILVSIEDTGIGITEADLDKIFERFFKSESRIEKERNSGMGLGLYICKQIVEKHGGKIWLESQLHKGSTFYFTMTAGAS